MGDVEREHVFRPGVVELFSGAGGLSRGLELAGFRHVALVDSDRDSCLSISLNRPAWNVVNADVRDFHLDSSDKADLLAASLPKPDEDTYQLWDRLLDVLDVAGSRAVLVENVAGVAKDQYQSTRLMIETSLAERGYSVATTVLYAANFGVPQLRPRSFTVGLRAGGFETFSWPLGTKAPPTVGEALAPQMGRNDWPGVHAWSRRADGIAPTIIGGSRKHGGPDLGPSGSKRTWMTLGVDPTGVADSAPLRTSPVDATPRLTLEMLAVLQGFEEDWRFVGRKTSHYRQIANALPPPLGQAIGAAVRHAMR